MSIFWGLSHMPGLVSRVVPRQKLYSEVPGGYFSVAKMVVLGVIRYPPIWGGGHTAAGILFEIIVHSLFGLVIHSLFCSFLS